MTEIPVVTENELLVVEDGLLHQSTRIAYGWRGSTSYEDQTLIYGASGCLDRGTRIRVVPVCRCRSYDTIGQYKNRSRWRTVYVIRMEADGPVVVCAPEDRDAVEIGVSNVFVRPMETAAQESQGRGLGAALLAGALEALGIPESPVVVVTRHPGLVEVLREMGLVPDGARVIAHATVQDVSGRHVIGVLPLSLAAEAASVREVQLNLPAEMRGQELSADQVRQYMMGVFEYKVTRQ